MIAPAQTMPRTRDSWFYFTSSGGWLEASQTELRSPTRTCCPAPATVTTKSARSLCPAAQGHSHGCDGDSSFSLLPHPTQLQSPAASPSDQVPGSAPGSATSTSCLDHCNRLLESCPGSQTCSAQSAFNTTARGVPLRHSQATVTCSGPPVASQGTQSKAHLLE